MNVMKRTLALLLAAVLIFGVLPGQALSVYAETGSDTPAAQAVESIFVSFFPEEQRYYAYGQELNTDGLELTVYYDDGSTELVTEGYSVSGFDSTQWGMQMLTVEYEGYIAELEVYVYLEGSCGDDVTYTFGPAGDLNIGGTGSMVDYADPAEAPWYPYRDQITMIYINEGIESIGANAFYGACNTFGGSIDVSVPLTVTQIGDNAFYGAEDMYVNFSGSRADWSQISIGSGNDALLQAEIYFGIVLPESMEVSKLPDKTEYVNGEELDTNGLELTVRYDDGNEYNVAAGFEVIGYNPFIEGKQTVTVTYEGLTATFDVTVSGGVTVVASGTCGENISWELFNDGRLILSGYGPMVSTFSTGTAPWYDYKSVIQSVEIEDGITTITANAFFDCAMITAVNIPDSVTDIGTYAFSYCESLETVTIPESVTYISDSAFRGCGLTSMVIPGSVTKIDEFAFSCCASLASVTIPDSVMTIAKGAFSYCEGLLSVWIPESVTSIGSAAFLGCNALTSVTIPGSLTNTGERVFAMCAGLNSVEILDGVTTIGEGLFQACGELDTIRIPASVTTIGKNAFERCTALSSVDFGGRSDQWSQITIEEGNEPLTAATIHCNDPLVTGIYVSTYPDKLSYLQGEELDLTGLVLTVSYSDGSTEEITEGFDISGYDPWMTGMQTVTVSYQMYTTTFGVDIIPGGSCGDNLIWTFDEMNGILTISGTGAMYDFDYAPWDAYRDRIRTVQICDGVTTIGSNAFYDHWSLTSPVNIPEGVTSIGSGAFYNTYMTAVTIPDGVESIGKDAFGWCGGLTELILPDSVTEIGDYAFAWCDSVTTVKLSSQLTAINAGVFQGCVQLQSIEIPQSVTKLGDCAFESCGLSTVEIPAGVTEIGSGVFQGSQIEQITVPNGVTRIGEHAFSNCYQLKSVALPNSLTEIDNYAFGQCGELTSVTIPGSVTAIGESVFIYCNALTEIIIENGVTTIGSYAFAHMPALASVTIPASVTLIESYAFSDVSTLTDVYYGGTEAQWKQVVVEMGNEVLGTATIHFAEAAPEIIADGTCGDSLTWTLDEEGTLTISGFGPMWNFDYNTSPWYSYGKTIKAVVFDGEITAIGDYAFRDCSALAEVSIPQSITAIGKAAFYSCTALTAVTIPGNVKTIGDSAFSNCTQLTAVEISEGVELIDDYAFYYTRLPSVTVPGSVKTIGRCAFALSALRSVTLCEGVEVLDERAFEHCDGITDVSVPSTLTSIGKRAFFSCDALQSFVIPEGVKTLEENVFYYCKSMTSLHIPASVTAVGDYATVGCASLTDVYFGGRKAQWNNISFGYGNETITEKATLHCAIPSVIVDIAVAAEPYRTAFFEGEPLDTTGLTLTALYDDGSTAQITEGFTVNGYDAYTVGKQRLTVSYAGYNASFYVTVMPIEATGIGIENMPYKHMYFVGDALDTTGMSLTVNYNNGSTATVTEGYEVTGYDPYMSGEQCVTVTYEGQSTYFYVNVQPIVATYIYVDTMPNKMMYFVGDQLDTTGMSLTVNYNNGNITYVTEGFEVSGYDPYVTGEQCVTISYEGQSTYFYVNVQPIMATYIYVDKMPDRTVYFVGDQLDTTGMSLMVTYNNGNVVSVTEGFEVMGYDPYMSGEQCVTVSYEGQTTYFNVMVSPIIVTHIGIDAMPNKTFYYVGEELDTTGMMLTLHYNNGDMVSVAEGYEVMGYDPYVIGEQCVTVTYEDQSTYFYVRVEPIVANGMAITTMPHKTAYFVGEELDTTGLSLEVYYNNGSTEYISEGYTVTGYDPNIIGEQCVTVTYEDQSTFFYVSVEPIVVTGIDIQSVPNKTAYLVGDELDTTGLELMVYYNNGTTTTVTEGYEVTGFDSTTPGTQILTVTYEGFTATFEVTVKDPVNFEIVSQPADVEITAGFVAQFTVEATDAATYKWQYRRNENAPWVNTTLPGYASATLSVPAILARNGYQYRCHITGKDKTVLDTVPATMTVNDSIFITQQPTRQIVGVDTNATFSVVADGAGLTYQWLYRKYDEDFWKQTGMTGNKTATLTVPAIISRNGYQYMCAITDENGIKIYSKVAVLSTIGFTVQPADQTAPVDTNAVFTVAAKGQDLTYKWQYRKSSTGSWLGTSLPGFNTNTLTVLATTSRNGYQYRCGITDALGTLVYSDVATLTVGSGIEITAQPADQMTPVTLDAVFTVAATGDGLTYQWQYRKSSTGSWLNTSLTGYNTDTLTVPALEDRHGYQYRCVITDAVGVTVTTDAATLSVRTTLLIHTQPANQTALVNTDAVFSLFATGIGVTYQWQYRAPGGSWYSTNLPGYDTNTLTVTAIAGRNNYQYRCQLTDANGNTMQSHTAVLTVELPEADAAITAQPTDQTAYIGENAIFSVTATGEGLTYQWQYQKVGASSNWLSTSLTGAKTDTLTVGALAARNGYRYRCVITDSEGNTLTSDSVTLTVNDPDSAATITSQPTDQTVAAGENAKFSVAVTGTGLTYQWQYCSGPDSGWINTSLTGAKTNTLTVAAVAGRNGYQYRCVITDAKGYVINSDIVTLTVE